MSFSESIRAGISKATQADANVQQVYDLLRSISQELQDISVKDIRLATTVSAVGRITKVTNSFDDPFTPREFFDSDQLCLINPEAKQSFPVAKWRQNTGGFPCILTFDGAEFICDNIDDLSDAMKILLSSANFGKILTNMMND